MEESKSDGKDSVMSSDNENITGTSDNVQRNKNDSASEDIKKKATLLFLQGKRCIYIKDYPGALATLSKSCMLFNQIYPEQHEALADPYFYYGKALLEVGRSESEILGDQVQDEEEDDDDDDDGDDDDDDDDNDNDNDNENENDNNDEDGNDDEEVQEKGNDGRSEGLCAEKSENETNAENGVVKEMPENDNKQNMNAENNTDNINGEINDLQLSWEYLELAKLIYLKKADVCKETAIKLAETYLCLGENGLESENYSTAIEDIKQALELQKKHLSKEDRRIAETYYQLGIAYALDQNYEPAIESFKHAIEQLETKISSLEMRKKIGDKKTEEEEKDAFYTMDGEINEIRNLIKEIEEKISDMLESKNKVKAEIMKQVYGQTSSSLSPSVPQAETSSIVVKDISHLVKRKRKSDESEARDDKKMKTHD